MPRPVLSVAASQAPPPISGRYDFSHGLERDAMAAAATAMLSRFLPLS